MNPRIIILDEAKLYVNKKIEMLKFLCEYNHTIPSPDEINKFVCNTIELAGIECRLKHYVKGQNLRDYIEIFKGFRLCFERAYNELSKIALYCDRFEALNFYEALEYIKTANCYDEVDDVALLLFHCSAYNSAMDVVINVMEEDEEEDTTDESDDDDSDDDLSDTSDDEEVHNNIRSLIMSPNADLTDLERSANEIQQEQDEWDLGRHDAVSPTPAVSSIRREFLPNGTTRRVLPYDLTRSLEWNDRREQKERADRRERGMGITLSARMLNSYYNSPRIYPYQQTQSIQWNNEREKNARHLRRDSE